MCTGSVVISAGVDGSVFLSDGLPPHMTQKLPAVPEIGASFDLDTPDDMHQLDEVINALPLITSVMLFWLCMSLE
jgi:hypothetical protein